MAIYLGIAIEMPWLVGMVALPQILCQLHGHAKQYDNDECVMMN